MKGYGRVGYSELITRRISSFGTRTHDSYISQYSDMPH
jgi:hypothetical protein